MGEAAWLMRTTMNLLYANTAPQLSYGLGGFTSDESNNRDGSSLNLIITLDWGRHGRRGR